MTILKLYTDGACSGNQNKNNIGGWGAVMEYGSHKKEIYGGEFNTTNNRMEMTALLKAFEAIKRDGQTIWVFSDSSYLMNCFRDKWYVKWIKNNWKNSSKKDVENKDLWMLLLPYLEKHSISFFRVKGHVNLNNISSKKEELYNTFKEWNGSQFTMSDFEYITDMNNLADALANKWMDENR